jgi:TolA-binding protein
MFSLRFQGWILLALALLAPGPVTAYGALADAEYAAATRDYGAGQWQAAAAGFQAFVAARTDHPRIDEARFYYCETLIQLDRLEEASQQFSEFLQRSPNHRFARQALFRQGECLFLLGKGQAALPLLKQFEERYPADPLTGFALSYHGDLALEAGDLANAELIFRRALELFPDSPAATDSRYGLGRVQERQGNFESASELYQRVAAQHEHALSDNAQLQLAVMQYGKHDYVSAEKTLQAFRATFEASEVRGQAEYWLGLAQLRVGKSQNAAETLARAAQQFSNSPAAAALNFAAGEALLASGQAERGAEQFQLVLAEYPDSPWADDALAALALRAFESEACERFDALAREFEQKYPRSGLLPSIQQAQARRMIDARQFAAAEALLDQLIASTRKSPESREPSAAPSEATTAAQASEPIDQRQTSYFLALAQIGQEKFAAGLQTLSELPAQEQDTAEFIAAVRAAKCSALLGLKRYDEAAKLLRVQIAAIPDANSAEATRLRSELAFALTESGQLAAAERELSAIAPADGNARERLATTLHLAELALAQKRYAVASRAFLALAGEAIPAEFRARGLAGLAWSQLHAGEKAEARRTFERLLEDFPDDPAAPEATLAQARLLDEDKQHEAALAAYQRVVHSWPKSQFAPAALLARAKLLDELQQDRAAVADLEKLIAAYSKFDQLDEALYTLAWALADLDQPARSDETFRRLCDQFPKSTHWADATYRLAEQAARTKQADLAVHLTTKLIDLPCDAAVLVHALYLRGQIAAGAGKWHEVQRDMQQIVEKFPDHAVRFSADYWLAEAAYRQDDLATAAERFEKLGKQLDGRRETWLAMIPLRQSQILVQQKEWSAALQIAQPIAERYPNFRQQHEVDYIVGRCLGSQAQFDEAREAYERVIASKGGGKTETAAMAQWMIGETYFHQKRYDEAIAAYQRSAIEFGYPKWQAASLLQAGKCRQLQGDRKAARLLYEKIIRDFADTGHATEADARLHELGEQPVAARNNIQ